MSIPSGLGSMRIARAGVILLALLCAAVAAPHAFAQQEEGFGARLKRLRDIRETQRENEAATVSQESLGAVSANNHTDAFDGRRIIVYTPTNMPEMGKRPMIVALHGGGGNAQFMLDHLKINGVAEKNGFIVAYLEGSAAANRMGDKMKAWNAGSGCCGKPYADRVDDVSYITGAVRYLQQKYGVDPAKTFGVGHSNGAIMMQTLACTTELFKTVVTLAGTLMAEVQTCPDARGHTIINYHGVEDINLPIAGGFGRKGVTNINFTSQEKAKERFEAAGGKYILKTLPGSDHSIEHMSVAAKRLDGFTIGELVARDLNLAPS